MRSHAAGGLMLPDSAGRAVASARAGFSMIELAMCLAIVGYMIAFSVQTMQVRTERTCMDATRLQLLNLQTAVEQFAVRHGRYPLPAGRSMALDDSRYGAEAPNSFSTSIQRVSGARPVLIGAFPASIETLAGDRGVDCWGNKITYAVTESLTTASGYADTNNLGGISLMRGRLAVPQLLSDDAAYIIISHGQDGLGASAEGYTGTLRNCNSQQSSSSVLQIDKENCDTNNAEFFTSSFSNGTNAEQFFDDIVVYGEKPPSVPLDCESTTVTWGAGCSAPALLTLAGLSVNVTNIASGYTGVAISTCTNGTRSTLGACLPIGTCTTTSPRTGAPLTLATGVGVNYGTGICKRYSCCAGTVIMNPLSPCPIVDLPGLSIICP